MKSQSASFDEHEVLHDLKHFLPAQAPLKDFIHHNTLHAFQNQKFYKGIQSATEIFGYKTSLSIDEYRELYRKGSIRKNILQRIITERKGAAQAELWLEYALIKTYDNNTLPRIGTLRSNWKRLYRIDMDSLVHPILFRVLCSYLDQGISIWSFPSKSKGFLAALQDIEQHGFSSFFRKERARNLLLKGDCTVSSLLQVLIGADASLYKQYLFDQQFAHQGWSGMVSVVEDQPQSLLDHKDITLNDLVIFELLLEIDALDFQFGQKWEPLTYRLEEKPLNLFAEVPDTEWADVIAIWQDAYEWTYYDEVLAGINTKRPEAKPLDHKNFQAMFCIDDREYSFRHYLETFDPLCETFGTPGFFSAEFFYQPEHGKFYTKLCPAPVTPKYLIKEIGATSKREKDPHFSKHSHSFHSGWLISQTLGFWAALKLFLNIFRPTMSPATASSFRHMDRFSKLTIEHTRPDQQENNLQIGFATDEMVQRAEGILKSTGLVKDFAPVVYLVGHGSSSVNNPHYAAYDCGACSGRAGSVNARVMSYMLNNPNVRKALIEKGITIPDETQFIGALHDTTRDEVVFFDEHSLTPKNMEYHKNNEKVFAKALDFNSKERSRRFESINTRLTPEKIHEKIRTRSVSLFEPRPELNHATNTLCIVGRRGITRNLFLDRRAFMNSFDYRVDPEGKYLFNILKAAAPVCGGINLEYFFSRVDNQKLGAGTKLPHNVMGLFGVANGIDGDLRPGLPSQMIEVHDPLRLLIIVEHFPQVVLDTIQKSPETYEWFMNEWVHLIVINPETKELYRFKDDSFSVYKPLIEKVESISDLEPVLESHQDNIPVFVIS